MTLATVQQWSYGFPLTVTVGHDLSQATSLTLRFQLTGGAAFDRVLPLPASIVDATTGVISYTVQQNDLALPGRYRLQVIEEQVGQVLLSVVGDIEVRSSLGAMPTAPPPPPPPPVSSALSWIHVYRLTPHAIFGDYAAVVFDGWDSSDVPPISNVGATISQMIVPAGVYALWATVTLRLVPPGSDVVVGFSKGGDAETGNPAILAAAQNVNADPCILTGTAVWITPSDGYGGNLFVNVSNSAAGACYLDGGHGETRLLLMRLGPFI